MKSLHTRWPRQCNNCKIEDNILKANLDRICLFLLFALVLQARNLSVIIDTDAGSDDLIAIAFLLSRTDVHVEAINVVSGVAHVPRGAENIRKLLALGRREDIPVHLGREQPIQKTAEFPAVWRKTADKLLATLPAVKPSQERLNAISYYRSRGLSETTILALGPLTNLATAMQMGVRFNEILMMGGALRVPGNLGDGGYFKTANKTAEWNMFCDPKAAEIVFKSGAVIRIVPLDATNEVPLNLRFLEQYQRAARSPLAVAVGQLLERDREVIRQGIYYAWDPLAAVALVAPEVACWKQLRIRIRKDGTTEETATGGTRAKVALHSDSARFHSLFLSAIR